MVLVGGPGGLPPDPQGIFAKMNRLFLPAHVNLNGRLGLRAVTVCLVGDTKVLRAILPVEWLFFLTRMSVTRDEGLTRAGGKAALRDLRGWGIVLNLVSWMRALPR